MPLYNILLVSKPTHWHNQELIQQHKVTFLLASLFQVGEKAIETTNLESHFIHK